MTRRKRSTAKVSPDGKPSAGLLPTNKELDAARDGSSPMTSQRGGGSVMGQVITEASFLRPPNATFQDSPFGQRYLTTKPKALSTDEVLVRGSVWGFSVRGYFGDAAPPLQLGVPDGEQLLRDWYSLVRDMAKRALKYKHLPTTLTDTDMLIYIMDVYYYLVANLATLINMNRLLQWNPGFARIGQQLPKYMSRITRLWRRASVLAMPTFLKMHAIRNGQIVHVPGVLAPTFRLWSPEFLLSTNGPTITALNYDMDTILCSDAHMGTFVTNLESAERWLEVGDPDIATDFIAVMDLINMTMDIVPGAFDAGLPRPEDCPGLSQDPGVLTDLLRRAVFRKDVITAGTDKWIVFPCAEVTQLGGRIPVVGFGSPQLHDFTLLGAPKYGFFDSDLTLIYGDVDSTFCIPGTEIPLQGNMSAAVTSWKDAFGKKTGGMGDETQWVAPDGSPLVRSTAFDVDVAGTWRLQIGYDSIQMMHPWDVIRCASRDSWVYEVSSIVDEKIFGFLMYMDSIDLGENWAEFLGKTLGVPYMKAGSGVVPV